MRGKLSFEVVYRYAGAFRAYGRRLRLYRGWTPTKAAMIPAETVAGVVAFKEGAVRTHTAHAYLVVKYAVRAYLVCCMSVNNNTIQQYRYVILDVMALSGPT